MASATDWNAIRSPISTRDKPDKEMKNVSLFSNFNMFRFKLRVLGGACINAFCLSAIITRSGCELLQRFRKLISELVWPLTGWSHWILGKEVKWLPQSTTAPLTSRWVHCGESQDAPVVGIERIRCTPWSADVGRTTSSYNSFQHSSNRCARCFSFRETAHGVQALDTCICFSKLCLFSTCRVEVSVKYLLYDIKK